MEYFGGYVEEVRLAASWVELLTKCVRSVSYRLKINGELSETITPQRGLRQGDPLSPYLFLICANGFLSLLQHAEELELIQGVKLCPDAPSVSHLLFADDSLILLKAGSSNATQLQTILDRYEACSGQVINREKSSAMFSKNTLKTVKQEIMHGLHLTDEAQNEKYLGLPVYIGRPKSKVFFPI